MRKSTKIKLDLLNLGTQLELAKKNGDLSLEIIESLSCDVAHSWRMVNQIKESEDKNIKDFTEEFPNV